MRLHQVTFFSLVLFLLEACLSHWWIFHMQGSWNSLLSGNITHINSMRTPAEAFIFVRAASTSGTRSDDWLKRPASEGSAVCRKTNAAQGQESLHANTGFTFHFFHKFKTNKICCIVRALLFLMHYLLCTCHGTISGHCRMYIITQNNTIIKNNMDCFLVAGHMMRFQSLCFLVLCSDLLKLYTASGTIWRREVLHSI